MKLAMPVSLMELLVKQLELLWIGDTKVAANLNRQVVVDFIMPWNSTASV